VNILGNLDMGISSAANSTVNTRIDSGSLTVGGALTIGLNNGGRWSVVDVNGGTLTMTNTTTGISVGGPLSGNAELLIRNGTVNAGIIGLGYGTVADTVVLNQTGGSLYLGSGGIVQVSTNATVSITLNGGLLGAITNWSCTNNIQLTGTSYTIQTADTNDNPQNIYLGGTLSGGGPLIKTGSGMLVISNADTCTGATTVSNGILALGASGSIATSPFIIVGSNATLDVSALGGFTLGSSQTLSNNSSTAVLNGNFNTGLGTVSLTFASGTPSFTVTNGTLTLSSGTIFKVNNTGAALTVGSYKVISTNINGSITGIFPSVVVAGNGVTGGAAASLQITNNELYLVVSATGPTGPAYLTNSMTGGNTLSLSWPSGQGWTLKVQTNHLPAGISLNTNDWMTVPGSMGINRTNITIDPTQPMEFYRLGYP